MRVPRYRKRHGRDFAFVEYKGKQIRLPGRFNSPESREAYKQFLVRVLGEAMLPDIVGEAEQITVEVIMAAFLQWAAKRYPGGNRGEWGNCKYAVRLFLQLYAAYPAVGIGPLRFKKFQQSLVDAGHSPRYINQCCAKIRRAFKWAASEEVVPITTYQGIATVQGVREPPREDKSIPRSDVDAILGELSPTIAAMAEFQWLTGARSQSICAAKPEQFDTSKDPWLWRPVHKTQHRGVRLVLPIGPKCQAVIAPFLGRRKPGEFLFNPREARSNRRYRDHYSSNTYCQHIQRAIRRVNDGRTKKAIESGITPTLIDKWSPHRLRHTKGNEVREKYGAEAAQAILGHESLDATELYSGKRLSLAVEVAKETG